MTQSTDAWHPPTLPWLGGQRDSWTAARCSPGCRMN